MLYSPILMHIPDGFLSVVVSILFWVLSILAIRMALRRVGGNLGDRQVPLMGVLAATIFAAQMLNFSVVGGTSGHLLGATLATIVLGPWAAMIVMTCVVGVQALVFQDGGLLALGANLFNMAVVAVLVSETVYQALRRLAGNASWGFFGAGALAAWVSIMSAALATALQVTLSGTSPANLIIPAMAGVHALIGAGETLITLGALAFLRAVRRDLFAGASFDGRGARAIWVAGLAIVVLLLVLTPLASTNPDGLEKIASVQGFLTRAQPLGSSLLPEYIFPGLSNRALATILAGLVGAGLVIAAVRLASRVK